MTKYNKMRIDIHRELTAAIAHLEVAQAKLAVAPVAAQMFEEKMRLLKQLKDVLQSAKGLKSELRLSDGTQQDA